MFPTAPGEPAPGSPAEFEPDHRRGVGCAPIPAWLFQLIRPGTVTPPSVPPSKVTDLANPDGIGSVLTWTAAGEHGMTGVAAWVDYREWNAPITSEAIWAAAIIHSPEGGYVSNGDSPGDPVSLNVVSFGFESYPPGTTVYWAVRYKNGDGAEGPISNLASYVVQP